MTEKLPFVINLDSPGGEFRTLDNPSTPKGQVSTSPSLEFLSELTIEEVNVSDLSQLSRAALIDKIVELSKNLISVNNQLKAANAALKVFQ
jgi:hypothetical protein